jgi:hypothetical protein
LAGGAEEMSLDTWHCPLLPYQILNIFHISGKWDSFGRMVENDANAKCKMASNRPVTFS